VLATEPFHELGHPTVMGTLPVHAVAGGAVPESLEVLQGRRIEPGGGGLAVEFLETNIAP
jgi:hypothetical protein